MWIKLKKLQKKTWFIAVNWVVMDMETQRFALARLLRLIETKCSFSYNVLVYWKCDQKRWKMNKLATTTIEFDLSPLTIS